MHISADFVTVWEKFLFQLKALQKRMQKDASRFFVAQVGPEIYEKNEMLKNRGMCFFVIHCRQCNALIICSHLVSTSFCVMFQFWYYRFSWHSLNFDCLLKLNRIFLKNHILKISNLLNNASVDNYYSGRSEYLETYWSVWS